MAESRRITYYLGLTDKLESEQNLSDEELSSVLLCDDPDFDRYLTEKARAVRERIYGKDVYLRGLIEFCAALKVVTFAVSLGHDESLIFPQPSYDERINLYPEKFRKGFIRFSVGLEEPEDIIEDLDQALRAVGL